MSLRIGNTIIPSVSIKLNSGNTRLQTKTVNPTSATQNVVPDSGYDALSKVTVNAVQTETKSITANGTYTPTSGKYFSSVSVNVSNSGTTVLNQNKTVTPSTSQQTITADSGYTGLGTVTVNAMPAMTLPTAASSTASGASKSTINRSTSAQYINIPTGYNSAASYYTISATPNMTLPTSAATSSSGTSKLTITPTTAARYINIPTGYNETASYYTISGDANLIAGNIKAGVSIFGVNGSYTGSGGTTINNQNKTVTPTTSQQSITADSGYTGLGTVTVNAMPTMTLPTSASSSVTSGFTSKATISRSTSDQYINIPTGYNSAGAYYKISAVPNGTAGTPIATKGTISNNSISITPSVTNTTGYITGSTKTGTAITVTASELVSGNKAITANGTNIDVKNYATVSVNVSTGATTLQNKTVSYTPTEAGQTETITADTGFDALNNVTIEIGGIDSTYVGSDVARQAAKTVTPSTSEQTAVAANTYTTGIVKVAAIPSNYVNVSSITKSSSDLTVSDGTVTAPAGYYPSNASASVQNMTLPTSTSTTSSGTRKATIDRSTSVRYINIPVGYNSSAAYYQISAVANGSATAPSSISGSSATISTGTNTITLTKTVSVTPTVSAGYISSGTATNSSVSLTASVTTKAAATITPGTTNQTIASGTYLTGTQTISGDADLVAANIKNGVAIFGVTGSFTSDANATAADIANGKTAYVSGSKITGTLSFITYRTGTSTPTSSLGSDGDIYLKIT